MSDLMQSSHSYQDASAMFAGTRAVETKSFSRALDFTRDTYRSFRAMISGPKPAPAVTIASVLDEALAATTIPASLPIAPDRALTPWDLIDENPSLAGVEFTMFQRRAREVVQELAA